MIEYVAPEKIVMLKVFNDGTKIGEIIKGIHGYYYQPKGSKIVGNEFNTIAEVKLSIETA